MLLPIRCIWLILLLISTNCTHTHVYTYIHAYIYTHAALHKT